LVIILTNANLKEKFEEKISLEKKKYIINNLLLSYKSKLSENNLTSHQISCNRSYILIEELCNVKDKMINKDTYIYRWHNLLRHAQTKSYNCRNQ
jgi:hypothetical protein